MEKSLEALTGWLKKSCLKVNQKKTDLCLSFKHSIAPVSITLYKSLINSKSKINVLGVVLDSKLQWSNQISKVILKANHQLNSKKKIL
jgi:hypothetical protein